MLSRYSFPIVLVAAAIVWILYTLIIKKNKKMAMDILKPTLFFAAVWGVIYYFIFK
ncbi:MAG TPA: hypothetical protein VK808_14370 [Bacteroidia bacterium]|jgi:hypothetical protein|nr:hypothetical protein [Bacteroidia bacterium]